MRPLSSGTRRFLVDADIFAVAQHGQRRGIGGGPADAEFFHALDEARLGVARRRLGEVLGRGDRLLLQVIAGFHRRQALVVLVVLVVLVLGVEREEAIEAHDLPGGAQSRAGAGRQRREYRPWCAPVPPIPSGWRRCASRSARRAGRLRVRDALHLRRVAEHVGRADRLMRFLRVLLLGGIDARLFRQIARLVVLFDIAAGLGTASGAICTPSVRI
jgi:hypothetical protein